MYAYNNKYAYIVIVIVIVMSGNNNCNEWKIRPWNFGFETMFNKTNMFKTEFSCPVFKIDGKAVFKKEKKHRISLSMKTLEVTAEDL